MKVFGVLAEGGRGSTGANVGVAPDGFGQTQNRSYPLAFVKPLDRGFDVKLTPRDFEFEIKADGSAD